MPVIKIREETEQVVYPASGQSNAAVIPLFVTSIGIETREDNSQWYYRVDLKASKFTKVSDFEATYKDLAIRDKDGLLVDKNYYMIKDLLNRGLEIIVKPVDLSSETLFPTVLVEGDEEVNSLLENIFDWNLRINNWDKETYRTGSQLIGTELPRDPEETDPYVDLNRPRVNPISIPDDNKNQILLNYHDLAKILDELISKQGFYNELRDKTRFNFKFLTTGSYENALVTNNDPELEVKTMVNICAALKDIDNQSGRGECFTLVDFSSDHIGEDFYQDLNSLYSGAFINNEVEYWKFTFCTYPWVIKKVVSETSEGNTSKIIPLELTGSYAYLKAFADYISENPGLDYMAIAGYNRGTVGDVEDCTPVVDLGEIDMHILQNDSFSTQAVLPLTVNPIIKCHDGMYRIWGNRVMLPLDKANGEQIYSDQVKDCNYFLNVRHLVSDIKKECYFASTRVSFEPNDDVTWFNFKSIVNPLLDNMVLNRGMEWYSWKRLPADAKGLMKAMLTIKPIEAVESFDITVFIRNTDEQ